jgi:ribosomal protein S18 acetylase RimI-like enzyme
VPFFENYQILTPEESILLYRADNRFKAVTDEAYTATTPSLFSTEGYLKHALEYRISLNQHLFKFDANFVLKYFVGLEFNKNDGTLCISCLYIGRQYRRNKLATKLIKHFQDDICGKDCILMASTSPENTIAAEILRKMGFIAPFSSGIVDDLGANYIDYFWSRINYDIKKDGNSFIVIRK